MVSWRQEGAAGLAMELQVLHWQHGTAWGSGAQFSLSDLFSGEASLFLTVLIPQGPRKSSVSRLKLTFANKFSK